MKSIRGTVTVVIVPFLRYTVRDAEKRQQTRKLCPERAKDFIFIGDERQSA